MISVEDYPQCKQQMSLGRGTFPATINYMLLTENRKNKTYCIMVGELFASFAVTMSLPLGFQSFQYLKHSDTVYFGEP